MFVHFIESGADMPEMRRNVLEIAQNIVDF
jgi:hypothetical protein